MSRYELRAEHQPADPVGRITVRWHIVRQRHLVAMCGRLIDPVSDRRSIRTLAEVDPDWRCADCWDWWEVVRDAHREPLMATAEQARSDAPDLRPDLWGAPDPWGAPT